MPLAPDLTSTSQQLRSLTADGRRRLVGVALDSILYGLRFGEPLPVQLGTYPPRLELLQACFVTLYRDEELRGCVGTLDATRALVQQVADSAFDAGFRDGRLPAVSPSEVRDLTIEISLLSELTAIEVDSERELFSTLRPGIDGLVIAEGDRRATFLPKVWDSFELPFDFVEHLKRKAGLPPRYWSPTLRLQRYTTESFGAAGADMATIAG
jgi:AmmeMemoRadiSam system protein A